jgi:hypothetical protein
MYGKYGSAAALPTGATNSTCGALFASAIPGGSIIRLESRNSIYYRIDMIIEELNLFQTVFINNFIPTLL